MSECTEKGHDWVPTGLYLPGGTLMVPCRRKDCKVERQQVWTEVEGPGISIDGVELDIEDDPQGGVAKVICREAAGKYDELNLQPGDVVIDIGAHVGIISIYLAKRYPGVKVYAFEPVRENYQRLCTNLHQNGAEGVIAINKAITGDGRYVSITVNASQNTGGGSMFGGPEKTHFAESLTLAQVFERYVPKRCALLKIDCEGAEYEILMSSGALLDRVDWLRGEFHINRMAASMGWTPQGLLEMCKQHVKPERIDVGFARMGD